MEEEEEEEELAAGCRCRCRQARLLPLPLPPRLESSIYRLLEGCFGCPELPTLAKAAGWLTLTVVEAAKAEAAGHPERVLVDAERVGGVTGEGTAGPLR
jgi:hypothetical protein